MHTATYTYGTGFKFQVGQSYRWANGEVVKLVSIWLDRKYGDSFTYECADGQVGDTSPNSFYYQMGV